jgi:AcrR family transcriptional regulator
MPAKRSNGIETAKKILKVAIKELEDSGPSRFNLDRVIENAEVSRSSLYHHYGSRDGLIIAVELHRLETTLIAGDHEIRQMLTSLSSPQEAWQIIELGIHSSATQQQRIVRAQRFASFAASEHAPALKESLQNLQVRAAEEFSETLRLARDRGFIDPVEPIEGTAHFIQSFLLGRMLVDIINEETTDQQWHEAAMTSLQALLRPRI